MKNLSILREREKQKTQNKNSFIIVSLVVATLLCGVLQAGEGDFTNKKSEFDFNEFNFKTFYNGSTEISFLTRSNLKQFYVGKKTNWKFFYS